MKISILPFRIGALILSSSLSLPGPSLALRQLNVGMEGSPAYKELDFRLRTGLEEKIVSLQQLKTLSSWKDLFGNDRPIILEIGFGIGESLKARARYFPTMNFLGIDIHDFGLLMKKTVFRPNEFPSNVKFVQADVATMLAVLPVSLRSFSRIYIDFPNVYGPNDPTTQKETPSYIRNKEVVRSTLSSLSPRGDLIVYTKSRKVIDPIVQVAAEFGYDHTWGDCRRDLGKEIGPDPVSLKWMLHPRRSQVREVYVVLCERPAAGLEEGEQARAVIQEFLGSSRQSMEVGKVALIGPGALEGAKGVPALWPLLVQVVTYLTPEERNAVVIYTENQGLLKLLREVGFSKSDSRIETIRHIFLPPQGVTLYTTPGEWLLRGQFPQISDTVLLTPQTFPKELAGLLVFLGYPQPAQLKELTDAFAASA